MVHDGQKKKKRSGFKPMNPVPVNGKTVSRAVATQCYIDIMFAEQQSALDNIESNLAEGQTAEDLAIIEAEIENLKQVNTEITDIDDADSNDLHESAPTFVAEEDMLMLIPA